MRKCLADRGDDRLGELWIIVEVVVELAMRFDALNSGASGTGHTVEHRDLINNSLNHLGGFQGEPPPTKTLTIRIRRVGPEPSARCEAGVDRNGHGLGGPGVTTCRHMGGRSRGDQDVITLNVRVLLRLPNVNA